MFEKEIIIDGRGHLLGRLASIVAKELLNGQKVCVVRCEAILKSGSLFRSKLKRQEKMHKRCNTNPRRTAIHWKAPSRIFWKVLRGMTPHKTPRGAAAMGRLKVFEGMPYPYDQRKRMVVPDALKVLRMKAHRNYCSLGDLAASTGWTKSDLVSKLEDKRKAKSAKYYELKQKKDVAREKALQDSSVSAFNDELKKYGF